MVFRDPECQQQGWRFLIQGKSGKSVVFPKPTLAHKLYSVQLPSITAHLMSLLLDCECGNKRAELLQRCRAPQAPWFSQSEQRTMLGLQVKPWRLVLPVPIASSAAGPAEPPAGHREWRFLSRAVLNRSGKLQQEV